MTEKNNSDPNSLGRTTYHVDPIRGNDHNSGLEAGKAWKNLNMVNRLLLAPGDRIEVQPGCFTETLKLTGAGTAENPIEIQFAPGDYDFHPAEAVKLVLHISNTNDDPYTPKPVGLLFREVRNVKVTGNGANLYFHGKMVEAMFDRAENIDLCGLTFDYRRPGVSEFTILKVDADHADVRVHPDSLYAVEGEKLVWVGEGWRSLGMDLIQEYDPAEGRVWRRNSPLDAILRVRELEPCKLRLFFKDNPGLIQGHVLQFRDIFRDCVGGFIRNSRNITLKNCSFHHLHGMGIVHQFSENLTYDQVTLAPRPGSGRTCAGWADLLHFSGCKGKIRVVDCTMSGTNDDPINVHGTHLRIIEKTSDYRIRVRFMHPQTYGFQAFFPGDRIDFVNHASLCAYASDTVSEVAMEDDKNILLTLESPVPEFQDGDVIENVTWTPEVEVRNCTVSVDSCRGFLLTTRKPILIENNTFIKTTMAAILIADDANSWFESGLVCDVTIRGNCFIQCHEPVIDIAPENQTQKPDQPVHRNIRILDNEFDLTGKEAISARSTKGLIITGNRFSRGDVNINLIGCTDVIIENNINGTVD
jgi:hypothetical protein